MQDLTSLTQAGDEVLCAFETCCGVLRSLEFAGVQAARDKDDERKRHIACAIELVREAISELRSIGESDLNAPAAGFVLAGEAP